MHVVLVVPPYDYAPSYGTSKSTQRGILPPLGVGYLAASLEARGHTAALVDAAAMGVGVAEAADLVLAEHPDVVGISTVTITAEAAYALAGALKERRPEIPVVMGGPHATSFAEDIPSECASIDVVVPGEGEVVFPNLVDRLSKNEQYEDLPGLVLRDGSGQIIATPVAEHVKDLDTIPNPARHIYRPELYLPLPNQCRRRPITTAITSRGCPWGKCAFCYQGGKYSPRYRQRSPEHVVDEIGHLVKDYGIREIIFWDDNFCIRHQWVYEFCDLLDKEKLDITWTVQNRVNIVTLDLLKRLAASGCYNILYGFESGNQAMLDLIDKGITLDESRKAVKWAKQAGLAIRGSFIFGMPTETPEMAEETIRFACELNVDWMFFFPYHVYPGTRLAELALREGKLLPPNDGMLLATYLTNTYESAAQLEAVVKSAYRRYYLRPRYIGRALWQARRPVTLKNYFLAALIYMKLLRTRKTKV